jgi:Ca2+/Na+ antiporter
MDYNYLYLVLLLVLFMFLARIFLPIVIYLLPVFLIIYIVKSIIKYRKIKKEMNNNEYTQTTHSTNQNHTYSSDSDIIDVDYKIVEEKETDTQ